MSLTRTVGTDNIEPAEAQERPNKSWEEFAPYLKAQARGPSNLGELDADFSEEAMGLMLSGVASPAQISGFLLVGRARTETHGEISRLHPCRVQVSSDR